MMDAGSSASSPSRDELLDLLQGELEPARRSPLYGVGLFLVAVVMILLPLIYVGLIVLAGYFVFWHATANAGLVGGSGGGFKLRLLVYLAPLVAGTVVCLFMIKPLFARPPRPPRPFSLDEAKEPLLFAWVERLCALVRAPMPRRIDVNCDVNASASFRRGLLSLFSRDLVLTIGIPLAAGMTLRQFTGVLAHEFGHFSQGGGMRLSYVIRSVNHWFARVVYERDSLDVALQEAQEDSPAAIALVAAVSRGCVWLSRRVLWVLMQTGHLISCFLLRQMEYDADRYEARVAGSEAFEETVHRLHALMAGRDVAMNQMRVLWSEKKLPDDLPAYCLAQTNRLDEKSFRKYMDEALKAKTDRWSTHPADADRIANALREGAPGLLHSALPATILFADFEALSRRVSSSHYGTLLGHDVDPRLLRSTTDLLEADERESHRLQGLLRFFQGRVGAEAMFFPSPAPPADKAGADEIREDLERIRGELRGVGGGDAERRGQLADRRLQLAMQLLAVPEMSSALERERASDEDARKPLAVLLCLRRIHPAVGDLGQSLQALVRQLEMLQENPDEQMNRRGFRAALEDLHPRYMSIRAQLDAVPYPFSHPDGEISCAEYAAPAAPAMEDPANLIRAAQQLLDLLSPLYRRSLTRLVEIAERAEAAVGLEPLEAPANEEPE